MTRSGGRAARSQKQWQLAFFFIRASVPGGHMGKLFDSCAVHLTHMLAATRFSLQGLRAAFRNELAFRQVVYLSAAGIPLAAVIADCWPEAVLLVLPFFLSLIVELLNTAVENTVNRISLERHPLAKIAKDTASAAQFMAQVFIFVTWGTYLIYKWF